MANYADITGTSSWAQAAAAAEDTIWHVVSGPVYLCRASATPDSYGATGIRFKTGDTIPVTAGVGLWYRMAAGSVAVIARSAFNTATGGF